MHDSRAARVGQELRPLAAQAAGRDAIQQSYRSLAGILHLDHLTATRAALLDHISEMFRWNVERQLLVPRQSLAARTPAGDHARTRHLKLVALATHRLH